MYNIQDDSDRTPLMWTVLDPWSNSPLLTIPFSHSRYYSDQAFQNSSTTAAQDLLSTNTVEELIAAGANLDTFHCSNRTASYWAAQVGRHYIAELLILQGASIQAVDHNQQTALDV